MGSSRINLDTIVKSEMSRRRCSVEKTHANGSDDEEAEKVF